MKKILIIGVIFITVLGLSVKFGIDYYLSTRFKDDFQNFINQAVNTKVSIESLSTNIFSRFSANNVDIWEPDGGDLFLSAGSLNFVYELSKILQKQLVINEVSLKDILINIVRYQNGRFNFEKFQNLVYDFSVFPHNKIYASNTASSSNINVNNVNISNMVLAYNDEVVNSSAKTGSLEADAVISPLDVKVEGKLFYDENVEFNLKDEDGVLIGDFFIKDIDAEKYIPFFNKYLEEFEVEIKEGKFSIDGSFEKKEELSWKGDIFFHDLKVIYAGVDFRVQNQKVSMNDMDISLKEFVVDMFIQNVRVSSLSLNGEFKNFNELKADFNATLFEADVLGLFEVLRQEMNIEKEGQLNGSVKMDIEKKSLKMHADSFLPSAEYSFLTEDKKKISFPFSNINLSFSMENMEFDIRAETEIFSGKVTVLSDVVYDEELLFKANFEAQQLSGMEFLKLNDMDKIPVHGEIESSFYIKGKNFEMATFTGEGDVIVTRAFFETLGLEKLMLKSSSETIRNLPMRDIKAKFRLEDEKFTFGEIEGSGDDFEFEGSGYVSTMADMDFGLFFSPTKNFLKSQDMQKYLTIEDEFRITLTGTVFSPRIRTNIEDIYKEKIESHLKEAVVDELKEKGKSLIKNLFGN
ncbi:MAG: hypothetical protein ACQESP_01930 [Candidatus Muiribacteriota bacterium]